MSFHISVTSEIKSLKKDLDNLSDVILPKIVSRSLNRTATSVRSSSVKYISPRLHSKQKAVKNRIHVNKANHKKWWVTLVASGKPLKLIAFKARQTKQGVKAKAWGKTKVYKNAFIAPLKGNKKGVFTRVKKSRLPIKQLWGPGITQLFKQHDNLLIMQQKTYEKFTKELSYNSLYYLKKTK